MKKFLSLLLFLLIFIIVVIVIGAHFFAEPQLKALIEQKGSEAISGQVTVQRVHIIFWPPLSLSLENLNAETAKKPQFKLRMPSLKLTIDPKDLIGARLVARIKVSRPELFLTLPTTTTPESATKKAAVNASGESFDVNNLKIALGLNLKLDDAKVEIKRGDETFALSKLNVDFLAPNIKSPWTLKMISKANNIPLELTSQFIFDGDHFQSRKTDVSLGGIKLDLAGQSTISREEHKWDVTLDVPELKNLIIPPQLEKNLKQWSGLLKGHIHAEHVKGVPWRAQGTLQAKNLETEVDVESSGNRLQGITNTNLDLDFTYQDVIVFNKIQSVIDLTKAAITSSQFVKPVGLNFKGAFVAQGSLNQFTISQSSVNLGPLAIMASGKINSSPGGISDLRLSIPSTRLEGLEKLFPALAATPLTGRLEVQGTVHGDLKNPKTLSVNINPLILEKVRGAVNWESADKTKSIHGPLTADGKIILVDFGERVSKALINLQANLSDLAISMGTQFQKKPHVPLKLSLKATQKGQALRITQSGLTTSAGAIYLKDKIQDLPRSLILLITDLFHTFESL